MQSFVLNTEMEVEISHMPHCSQ